MIITNQGAGYLTPPRVKIEWWYPTAFHSWGEEEFAAIERVRVSGQWTQAEEVEAFEQELAAFHGRKHAIYANSGSSANLLMVAALFNKKDDPLRRGDRAIVPAIAWPTLYAPIVQHGMDLIVADADDTWCSEHFYSPKGLAPQLVVGCSVLGNPAHLAFWSDLARSVEAYFIDDNCESLGASIDGDLCGTFGLMSSVSFFISHQLSAIEGGAVLTDDDEMAHLCRLLCNHGNEGFVRRDPSFDESYDFTHMGYNLRGLEMHAAIAREQLKKLPRFIEERRTNYQHFINLTRDLPIAPARANGQMSPFGFHFETAAPAARTRLVQALRAEGIDCRPPCGGSFLAHSYGAPWRETNSTPRADLIHSRALFLGLAPWPIPDKIEKAVEVMRRVL